MTGWNMLHNLPHASSLVPLHLCHCAAVFRVLQVAKPGFSKPGKRLIPRILNS